MSGCGVLAYPTAADRRSSHRQTCGRAHHMRENVGRVRFVVAALDKEGCLCHRSPPPGSDAAAPRLRPRDRNRASMGPYNEKSHSRLTDEHYTRGMTVRNQFRNQAREPMTYCFSVQVDKDIKQHTNHSWDVPHNRFPARRGSRNRTCT